MSYEWDYVGDEPDEGVTLDLKCDRCGLNVFYEDANIWIALDTAERDGWTLGRGKVGRAKVCCPSCCPPKRPKKRAKPQPRPQPPTLWERLAQ